MNPSAGSSGGGALRGGLGHWTRVPASGSAGQRGIFSPPGLLASKCEPIEASGRDLRPRNGLPDRPGGDPRRGLRRKG